GRRRDGRHGRQTARRRASLAGGCSGRTDWRSRHVRACHRRHPPARGPTRFGRPTRVTLPLTSSDATGLLGVYARVGPLFVACEGSELIAEDGTRYLDFVAGIAVNALGYNSPVIRDAVLRALDSGLIHVSNLYRTEPGERLAAELTKSFGGEGGQVFFCNSGAEANEGAFKFARKWSKRTEIVAFTGSFHGRLFASLAATDRPDYRRPFEPLLAGVQIVPLGDVEAATRAITKERTAAVIIEPVQGEGGVRSVADEFLVFLRKRCSETATALIF